MLATKNIGVAHQNRFSSFIMLLPNISYLKNMAKNRIFFFSYFLLLKLISLKIDTYKNQIRLGNP